LRLYNNNVKLRTVDSDWGVGILTKDLSESINVFPNDAISWDFFDSNRNTVLDIITPDEFLELYPVEVLNVN